MGTSTVTSFEAFLAGILGLGVLSSQVVILDMPPPAPRPAIAATTNCAPPSSTNSIYIGNVNTLSEKCAAASKAAPAIQPPVVKANPAPVLTKNIVIPPPEPRPTHRKISAKAVRK